MEFIQAVKRPPVGDELGQLADQLSKLRAFLLQLDESQALYICNKDSHIFGSLSKGESEGPRKRIRAEVEKKILDVEKEIRKQLSG